MQEIGKEGIIERNGAEVIVRVKGKHWSTEEGIECLTPELPKEEQIHQKIFRRKPVYLPQEYDRAVQERLYHPDNLVISMNGYSEITPDQCMRYGVFPGAYEQACAAILRHVISSLREKFSGAHLRLIHGASNVGVDWAIEQVADDFNIIPLGFSYPAYMLYVKDDGIPVYVARTRDEYSDFYIRAMDLLITTGGRERSLQHDVLAACVYGKRIHFIDVLNSLSSTGGVPATIEEPDGRKRVDNAAAAFGRNISFFSRDDALIRTPNNGDIWDAIFDNVASVATGVCRQKMSPARKFK